MRDPEPMVFVVDDDLSVREAVVGLVRSAGFRVTAFASAQEFLEQPRAQGPSCLVLDVRLPGLSGLDLQKRLQEVHRDIPIVFITGDGDIPMSVQAMKAGAVEFLTKPFRDQELIDGIREAIARSRSTEREESDLREIRQRYESLTPRERQVMAQVVQGRLNKQVAAALQISEVTVKLHRGQVTRKMRAESLADLVRMAGRLKAR